MRPRFLVPDLDPARPEAVLPPEEGHHLRRVLRLTVGDDIAVFDGRGTELVARVASIAGDTVIVTLLERASPASMPRVALTLVQSVLKAAAMDDVVRDCTMVGVHTIQPVVSERTTVKAVTLPKAIERWGRIALASAKQCGRSTLPQIRDPAAYADWLRSNGEGETFILLEPSAETPALKVRDLLHRPVPQAASLLVGPEGGWTSAECRLALEKGCTALSLGPLTLRADAVALAASAILLSIWDDR
jgi:16S rRNA (uracil1498-N3)-methyltransferase